MSVDRTDYIIYGWKLPYDKNIDYFNDKYLPYVEGHKGIKYSLIIDGMCGKYIVFGQVIHSEHSCNGWDFEMINTSIDTEGLINKYCELFNVQFYDEPYLFIFSHFS